MNKKQSILPPKREIERVCQIVSKPGFRRVNIGLKPNASEAEKIKYDLCKSIVHYQQENDFSETELTQKLGITQTKLEYIIFCHLDKVGLEELKDHVNCLTGHSERKINNKLEQPVKKIQNHHINFMRDTSKYFKNFPSR